MNLAPLLPLYFMSVLELPAWAINEIEKKCRGFLWKGDEDAAGSCSLVAWEKLCLSIEQGGLGIRNLCLMGIALRTRWIWLRRAEPERPWMRVAPLADRKSLHCFAAGSKVLLGNGASTSFWCDSWLPDGGSVQYRFPILFSFVKLSDITVAAALCDNSWIADIRGGLSVQAMGEYLALWDVIAGISLDPGSTDSMIWKAAPNGDFSVQSAYSILSAGRTSCPLGKIIWKSRAPVRCKFFMFLAVRNACLTADNLQRRGWKHAPICHLCSKDGESCQHIFQACTFSQQVWVKVQARLSLSCSPPSSDFAGWWLAARQTVAKIDRKTFDARVILVTWLIWKECNARVFEGTASSVTQLCATMCDEWKTWKSAGLVTSLNVAAVPALERSQTL